MDLLGAKMIYMVQKDLTWAKMIYDVQVDLHTKQFYHMRSENQIGRGQKWNLLVYHMYSDVVLWSI